MIEDLQQLISSTVRKVGGIRVSDADVEDLTQDVNIILMTPGTSRSLNSFDETRGHRLSTFVYMVTQSVVLDVMRMRRRRPESISTEAVDPQWELQASEDDVLCRLLERERIEMLGLAIESLPKADRDLAHVVFGSERTIEEYAQELGVSVNSLYVRKCRIIKRLIKTIARHLS